MTALDIAALDAATAPGVQWSPWKTAALLGVRVARLPMADGFAAVALRDPARVYLRLGLSPEREEYLLTFGLLSLCRTGWSRELVNAEAAYLTASQMPERGAA